MCASIHVRWSGTPLRLEQMLICLDIFRDVELLRLQHQSKYIIIELTPGQNKADLNESQTMQLLLHGKES